MNTYNPEIATVWPVYKSGDKTEPNFYSYPISVLVLPCVAKVMEKSINKQLIGFLKTTSYVKSNLIFIHHLFVLQQLYKL